MKISKIILTSILLTALFFAGCSNNKTGSKELTIGLMPAVDAAPIYVAQEEGYFKELGLNVTLQLYTNAIDRQSALQSGQIDGTISDIIALINNVSNGFQMKATSSTDCSFPVVFRNGFDESSETASAALMEISVVNYLADRYLGDTYKLNKIYMNDIPARIEMLKSGQVDLAVLPEPMASNAQLSGLKKAVYDNPDSFSPDLLVFTNKALTEKKEAVSLFHQAYNKAVERIQKDDQIARDLLVSNLSINPDAKDLMVLPEYQKTRVPDKAYISQLIEWTSGITGTDIKLDYDKLIYIVK